MSNALEVKATEILVSLFTDAGWDCKKEDIDKLQDTVIFFINESRDITTDTFSDGYAVLSWRIMKSVHQNKKSGPSNTKMGRRLFMAEKRLIRKMEKLGMYGCFENVPKFSIIVTEENRNKVLLYSRDFGCSLMAMGVEVHPKKSKKSKSKKT